MATLKFGIVVADLGIPRMHPCSALISPYRECGATPASLYRRECIVAGHSRDIWICPVHVMQARVGLSICRECGSRGSFSMVTLRRLTGPVRIPL